MSRNIIAIAGLKNSGKTEVANMLDYLLNSPACFHNYWCYKHLPKLFKRWHKVAFADTLKQMLASLLNIDICRFEDREFKENTDIELSTLRFFKNPVRLGDRNFVKLLQTEDTLKDYSLTVRQLMQYFGTEICQKYFGKNVWINTVLNNPKNLIISDLRFKAEAKAVKNKNGKLIYIYRPGIQPGNHASEKEVIDLLNDKEFDFIIKNDSSLKVLFYKIKALLRYV